MKGTNKRIRMAAGEFLHLTSDSIAHLTGPRRVLVVQTTLGKVADLSNITCVKVRPYNYEQSYWADIKTGTLYDEDGRCMTSSARQILWDYDGEVENRDWEAIKTFRIRSGDPNVETPRAISAASKASQKQGRPKRVLDSETAKMMLMRRDDGKWQWPNVYFAEVLNVSPEYAGKLRVVAANQLMQEAA